VNLRLVLDLTLTGLVVGSFYALMALGYTVFYGIVRLINFAHGDIYMLGAFVGFTILGLTSSVLGGPIRILLSVAGTLAVTALLGFLVRWLLTQVKTQVGAWSPMIAAVGISLVLEGSAQHIWGTQVFVYQIQFPQNAVKIFVTLGICFALLVGTDLFISRTKPGAAMTAVGIDHDAVRMMGIRVNWVIFATFLAFSAIAGVTGYLAGSYYGSIQFLMGFALGLKGFTATVLGGIGNVRGALVGGWTLGLIEAYGGGLFGTEWTDVIAFSVLITVLVFRPQGILGEAVVERM
jgi:branched-chain amino acid transport system permease protein